jgi:hypothetical protein
MTSLWAGLIPRQLYHIVSLMYRHLRDTTLALIIPPWAANALPRFGNVTPAKSAANAALLFHLRIDGASGCVSAAVVQAGSVVYMQFVLRKGWYCQFLEEDMKTPLPRKLAFADDRKIWEIAKSGGFTFVPTGIKQT